MTLPYGVFITFEGSEGCGKTTQIQRLAARLKEAGQPILLTREPGGTPLGESIRHLLKFAEEGKDMTPEAELLLFAASRAQLVRRVIEPALEAGQLGDRGPVHGLDDGVPGGGAAAGPRGGEVHQ